MSKKVQQANQWTENDPRQKAFLAAYLDPKSETWSNALQSALRAGFAQEYAENITHLMPDWLSEALGDNILIQKALNNLNDFLSTDDEKLQSIKADLTKFTLKGLQKNKFSERSEVTGKDGKDIIPETLTSEDKQALLGLIGK